MQSDLNLSAAGYKKLFIFLLSATAVVVSVLVLYQAITVSLLLSLIITYLVLPIVNWIANHLPLQRSSTIIIILFVLAIVLTFLGIIFLPIFFREAVAVIKLIPEATHSLVMRLDPIKQNLVEAGYIKAGVAEMWLKELDFFEQFGQQARSILTGLWENASNLMSTGINLVLTPVMVFFFLSEMPRIRKGVKRLVPQELRPAIVTILAHLNEKLRAVVKGQVTVAFILGLLYIFGLNLVDFKASVAIGAIAGVCRFVPYLDVIVGMSLCFVVLVTQNSPLSQFLSVSLVFLTVQVIDGMLITPRVMGERAGIHPGLTIVSVIAFGNWFGFFGILLAIPVLASALVLIEYGVRYYRTSFFFLGSSVGYEALVKESKSGGSPDSKIV